MIVVTGAAGFIGSNMVSKLIYEGYRDIILVDDFSKGEKYPNFQEKAYQQTVDRAGFLLWLDKHHRFVQFVLHLGGRISTQDLDAFRALNLEYAKQLWGKCVQYGLPLIYTSSAETYGNAPCAFSDTANDTTNNKPSSLLGTSKNEFDKWALAQTKCPYFWAGVKLFDVFGPNEYHKGENASLVFRAFNQITKTGEAKLYKASSSRHADGELYRDFIYVKDVTKVLIFLMELRKQSGIYNLGSGKARTYKAVAAATFDAMGLEKRISYTDMPDEQASSFQEFTQANMQKLKSLGYPHDFMPFERAVRDYVQNYLLFGKYN